MGVRKNAAFLSDSEREAFVRACAMMKADMVPGAATPYSRWDEAVAIHRMIQNANAPDGTRNINFGHGGGPTMAGGAYSFLSWHRYFLLWVERRLQSYVPSVTIPYWDWTDPRPLMTETFLGPNGDGTNSWIVGRGYFAEHAPGTPENPTPRPMWWPATLAGWTLPSHFPSDWRGPLKRSVRPTSFLPTGDAIAAALRLDSYGDFQKVVETGTRLDGTVVSGSSSMHNGLHVYIGGRAGSTELGHMSNAGVSPFDPIFYLHHANIDRLWAMWQLDGHADVYPASGGKPHHHRNDLMYPWTGGTAGYSTNAPIPGIPMPNFASLGPQRNVDTLDHRALGYTYDTMPIIGIGLDRTGSMLGLTPDPMTGASNVTKWEAAKRGVAAFLRDCETVQASGIVYVVAGVKTFRSLPANEFAPVFPGTPYGLVKAGSGYSSSAFESAVAGMDAYGGTPLADALRHVQEALVTQPFGGRPADELRYLAMLTDGMRTSGALMSSIPDRTFSNTGIFAMGFGTAGDVDYPTIQSMVDKGRALGTMQVFHGENAGVIDKFYGEALARAIGFRGVFDPVLELFAGEHTHVDFTATSAEDCFLVTVQGMDFDDTSWSFSLVGPDGHVAYASGTAGLAHAHGSAGHGHGIRRPQVTARRGSGRLSLVLQRDSADDAAWVGPWSVLVAYRALDLGGMMMPELGELLMPVGAGPVRGPRFQRLLSSKEKRRPARDFSGKPRHGLDFQALSTNRHSEDSCAFVLGIHARTRLDVTATPSKGLVERGKAFKVDVEVHALLGTPTLARSFVRMVAPAHDLPRMLRRLKSQDVPHDARLKGSSLGYDAAKVFASFEKERPALARVRDEELAAKARTDTQLRIQVPEAGKPGIHHFGIYVEGRYCPEHSGGHHGETETHGHAPGESHAHEAAACGPDCCPETFTRLLNLAVAVHDPSNRREAEGEEPAEGGHDGHLHAEPDAHGKPKGATPQASKA